ncbi:MAG: PTS sugar transporter subunit IIC [Acholeplasmatales bacterium]|nr:PTS sugar transporter subunit IIC [Acholeplasmatales bacterium]
MENNEKIVSETVQDSLENKNENEAKEAEVKEEVVEKEPQVKVEDAKASNDEKSTGKKILDFFITTLNGMAIGLFATLIIGTIINTIGKFFPNGDDANAFCNFMYNTLVNGSTALQFLTGAGIGVGIALSLKFNPLQTIVLAAVGELAAYFSLSTAFVTAGVVNQGKFQIGDPLTIFIVVILVAIAMKYILKKKTPVDILIVPLLGVSLALIIGMLVRFPAIYVTYGVQYIISVSTNAVPFVMGIVIAVLMGMALTAPISSAAIGAMVFVINTESMTPDMIHGIQIASGAAIVGCCVQMVGFAVQSRRDNNIGMVISIGIGTSMLQFKNIMRKPMVWLPTIIVSAILGPVSTCWLELVCMGSSAGMGTAGLVGQIGTYSSMGNTWQTWVGIFALEVIAPAILVYCVDLLFRRFNLIKDGDLKV